MTIEQFYLHVQEYGFNGFEPGKSDLMGDTWARNVGDVIRKAVLQLYPTIGEKQGNCVLCLAQWVYCELCNMRHRVVASPPALRACGHEITETEQAMAVEALLLTQSL